MEAIAEILLILFMEIFMCIGFNNRRTYIPKICCISILVFLGVLVDIPIFIWMNDRYHAGKSILIPILICVAVMALVIFRVIIICKNSRKYETVLLADETEIQIEKCFTKRRIQLETPAIIEYALAEYLKIEIDCMDEMNNFTASYNEKFHKMEQEELNQIKKLTDNNIEDILEKGIEFDSRQKRKISDGDLLENIKLVAIEISSIGDKKYKLQNYIFQTSSDTQLNILIRENNIINIRIK